MKFGVVDPECLLPVKVLLLLGLCRLPGHHDDERGELNVGTVFWFLGSPEDATFLFHKRLNFFYPPKDLDDYDGPGLVQYFE